MTQTEIAASYIAKAEQCEKNAKRQSSRLTVRSLKESAADYRRAAERVLVRGIGH